MLVWSECFTFSNLVDVDFFDIGGAAAALGLFNTPKPLRFVKGSFRIVLPEFELRLMGLAIPEIW